MAPSLPPFTDPFQSDRKDSSSSNGSEYLRPNAFAGHRDTLARVPGVGSGLEDRANEDEAFSSSARSSVSIDSFVFPGYWDTLARIPRIHRRDRTDVLAWVMNMVLCILPHTDYLSLRLVCRRLYKSLPQPRPRASHRLPAEVLHIIFKFLEPSDFDAARHASKQWFCAGMDLALLRSMLRNAYCQQAFKADMKVQIEALQQTVQQRLQQMDPIPSAVEEAFSEEWLMAKRLATTSRLSSDWRGRKVADAAEHRLYLVEEINFRRLLLGQTHQIQKFTASACGKYLLIMSGHDVFVYRLKGTADCMEAVVRLAADRQLLQISMDTSSGRYAVAGLLENRVGILWDLHREGITARSDLHSGEAMTLGMRTEVHGPMPISSTGTKSTVLSLRRGNIDQRTGSDIVLPSFDSSEVSRANSEEDASDTKFFGDQTNLCSTPEQKPEALVPLGGITIQTRSSAMYKNLGSSDDEPRSVAICPQRKCVAFGCRLG